MRKRSTVKGICHTVAVQHPPYAAKFEDSDIRESAFRTENQYDYRVIIGRHLRTRCHRVHCFALPPLNGHHRICRDRFSLSDQSSPIHIKNNCMRSRFGRESISSRCLFNVAVARLVLFIGLRGFPVSPLNKQRLLTTVYVMDVYSPLYRRILALVPAILLVITSLLSLHDLSAEKLDACFIARELEPHPPNVIPIADSTLHNLAVAAVWIAMLTLLTLPQSRVHAAYTLAYTALWFHSTYILLAALKAPLDDFNCSGRHPLYPNGISGHYCYFVFVSLTVPLLIQARLRSNPSQSRKPVVAVAIAFLIIYAVSATATLYRTLIHGYHSPRQILLGTALGMGSHCVLDRLLFDRASTRLQQTPATAVAILISKSFLSFSLYNLLWPFATAGPAVTRPHIAFHAVMWCILFACSYLLPPYADQKPVTA